VIYADFESIREKIDTVSPNPNQSFTSKYQKHTPCGFCYYIKSSVGDEHKLEFYRGEDALEEFVKHLEKDCIQLSQVMKKTYKPMPLIKEEKKKFRQPQAVYHICEEKISEGLKVRDHCHLTGKYRGPAHQSFNLNFKLLFHSSISSQQCSL